MINQCDTVVGMITLAIILALLIVLERVTYRMKRKADAEYARQVNDIEAEYVRKMKEINAKYGGGG